MAWTVDVSFSNVGKSFEHSGKLTLFRKFTKLVRIPNEN